jgi:osmotically-inducible protein OsmY
MRALPIVLAGVLVAPAAFAGTDTDLEIKERIESRLAKAGLAEKTVVEVRVESGVARLEGVATLYADVREADRLARKETRSVINVLKVIPLEPRSDRSLREEAEGEVLAWERYGPFDAVSIDVHEGIANLRGWVDTPYKKDEIEDRLAHLEGLTDVRNDLRVQGFSAGDQRLRQQIHTAIYRDPMFERWRGNPDPPVRVFVDKGRVTLAGKVGSVVEQAVVNRIARSALAFSVNNQVQVEGEAAVAKDRKKDGES